MLTGLSDRKTKSEVGPQGHPLGFQNPGPPALISLPGSVLDKSRSESSFLITLASFRVLPFW